MLGWDSKFNLGKQIKKIIILLVFLAAFPIAMKYFGVDVINDCSTYTIADYEAAKSDTSRNIAQSDIGQCVELPDSIDATSSNTYVGYFKDVYLIYTIIIAALIIIIPGYNILRYELGH